MLGIAADRYLMFAANPSFSGIRTGVKTTALPVKENTVVVRTVFLIGLATTNLDRLGAGMVRLDSIGEEDRREDTTKLDGTSMRDRLGAGLVRISSTGDEDTTNPLYVM